MNIIVRRFVKIKLRMEEGGGGGEKEERKRREREGGGGGGREPVLGIKKQCYNQSYIINVILTAGRNDKTNW